MLIKILPLPLAQLTDFGSELLPVDNGTNIFQNAKVVAFISSAAPIQLNEIGQPTMSQMAEKNFLLSAQTRAQ